MTADEIAAIEAQAVRAVARKIDAAYRQARERADTDPDPEKATFDRHYADGLSIAAGIALHEAERLERR